MIDPLSCPSCSFANALGAESCAKCGSPLQEIPERVHPGETLRDPDDLTLPPSPLLRAVLRGEADAASRLSDRVPAPAAPARVDDRPPAAPAPVVVPTPAAPAQVVAPTPVPDATRVIEPVAMPVAPRRAEHAPPAHRPASVPAEPERLSASADHEELLHELAERLNARKPAAPAAVPYAGFFVRAIAFLIDGCVLALFALPLGAAAYFGVRAGLMALGATTPLVLDESAAEALIVAWFVMATIYFTALHRSHGQTIGKSVLGLHVHDLHFGKLGLLRSLLRTLGYAVSSSFFGFGFLLAAFTPRKRGWHDFIAGTCVVRGAVDAEVETA